MANFGYQNPPMAHFHGVLDGNCTLRYAGRVFVIRKLEFRGLKRQYDVKEINFRGLIARIGYYRPILATRTHLWPIFMECVIGIVL